MSTHPPITPAFAWAHPEIEPVKRVKNLPKQVSNPLLKRASPRHSSHAIVPVDGADNNNNNKNTGASMNNNGFSSSPATRQPFSPVDNNQSTLRQRRKPSGKAILPPKSSLTEGYQDETVGSNNESSNNGYVGGADVVVWNGNNNSDSWESWVLVHGFSSKTQFEEVLRRFESFGKIVSQRECGRNWVALHYESNLEAEKALCQRKCILSDGNLIGVSRMDERLSQTLEWDAGPSSMEVVDQGLSQAVKNGLGEDDVLLKERSYGEGRGGSVCEKFLAFVFGWDDVEL